MKNLKNATKKFLRLAEMEEEKHIYTTKYDENNFGNKKQTNKKKHHNIHEACDLHIHRRLRSFKVMQSGSRLNHQICAQH